MSNPATLGVNIDHVATLRQARGTRYPDPVFAAQIAEQSGADSITFHLREELTTEGGLDVAAQVVQMREACAQLADVGTRVSPFIDASFEQIDAVIDCGAPCVEIHTGHYADASGIEQQKLLERLIEAISYAHDKGLQVNAGHGLNYHNVQAIAAIPQVHELNIGHAIIADAVFNGLSGSIREMKRLIVEARA